MQGPLLLDAAFQAGVSHSRPLLKTGWTSAPGELGIASVRQIKKFYYANAKAENYNIDSLVAELQLVCPSSIVDKTRQIWFSPMWDVADSKVLNFWAQRKFNGSTYVYTEGATLDTKTPAGITNAQSLKTANASVPSIVAPMIVNQAVTEEDSLAFQYMVNINLDNTNANQGWVAPKVGDSFKFKAGFKMFTTINSAQPSSSDITDTEFTLIILDGAQSLFAMSAAAVALIATTF